jgi:hypothetical protein
VNRWRGLSAERREEGRGEGRGEERGGGKRRVREYLKILIEPSAWFNKDLQIFPLIDALEVQTLSKFCPVLSVRSIDTRCPCD